MTKLASSIATINRATKQNQISARVDNTTLLVNVLTLLIKLGYISSFSILDSKKIMVYLKYLTEANQTLSTLRSIRLVSKPSNRVYVGVKNLAKLNKNININSPYSVLIISTPGGLKTNFESVQDKYGGEVLCIIN